MNISTLKKQLITIIPEVKENLEAGIFPAVSKDHATFLENNPAIIFLILQILLYGYSSKKMVMNENYQACYIILVETLNNIRFALEKNYTWAVDILNDFQKSIIEEAFNPQNNHDIANLMISAVLEAQITLTEELKMAAQNHLVDIMEQQQEPDDTNNIENIFENLAASGVENSFVLFEILSQQMSVLPVAAQSALVCEMFTASSYFIRELTVLTLLHPDAELRAAVLHYLKQAPLQQYLTPISLRRMIGIRNWLPESERPQLDAIIKRARKLKIECAAWPKSEIVSVTATEFDGAGAQGILIVSKDQDGQKLNGFVVKENKGIKDSWCSTDAMSSTQIEKIQHDMTQNVVAKPVTMTYLNKLVGYYLWLGLTKDNQPPMPGFLELAEVIGISDWHATLFTITEELSYLLANIDMQPLNKEFIETSLQRSQQWLKKQGVTLSWFEDDAEVAALIQSHPRQNKVEKTLLKQIVLEKILEPRREKWANRFLWMALWAKDIADSHDSLWCDFAITANEIFNGRPLHQIPIFCVISEETVVAMI